MRYHKPSVLAVGAASKAIQSFHLKSPANVKDSDLANPNYSSGGCYDLDE